MCIYLDAIVETCRLIFVQRERERYGACALEEFSVVLIYVLIIFYRHGK